MSRLLMWDRTGAPAFPLLSKDLQNSGAPFRAGLAGRGEDDASDYAFD